MEEQRHLTQEMHIDFGTATTRVVYKDYLVLEEPTIVAVEKSTGKMIAVGEIADTFVGRNHKDILLIKPIKEGKITSVKALRLMLSELVKKISIDKGELFRIKIGVPSEITEVEYNAMKEAVKDLNAEEVVLVESAMAVAIGAGVDVQKPEANMIVDIGEGITEIAVITDGEIVMNKSLKLAGKIFTDDIILYLKNNYNLLIGEKSAERVKVEVGSALEELDIKLEDILVQGRDMITGMPLEISVGYKEIAKALDTSITKIENAIKILLEDTPPEFAVDIWKTGIYLAGGSAKLRGFANRLKRKIGLPIHIVEDPLRAVVYNVNKVLSKKEIETNIIKESEIQENYKFYVMEQKELKNVKFLPWVGKNYEKGINGKKILVLGESHYGSEERADITNDVVSRFLKYHKGEGEFEPWMNTNTKFAKTFNNGEMSKEEIVEFWESVVFYNYVQTLMPEPRQSPTSEQFENSKEAFCEVVEKYQPDLIVVWGLRLWGAMPDQGRWSERSQVNNGEGLYYYQIRGKEYPAIAVIHPSTGFNYASAYEDIKIALSELEK